MKTLQSLGLLLLTFWMKQVTSFTNLRLKSDTQSILSMTATDESKDTDFSVSRREPLNASLTPPPINLRKESLLFGTNPASKAENNSLKAWKWCKQNLPYIVTGSEANSTVADENPLAGLYNLLLVRMPTILAGALYCKNLVQGHPLIVDVGGGPGEVPPILVGAILYAILR